MSHISQDAARRLVDKLAALAADQYAALAAAPHPPIAPDADLARRLELHARIHDEHVPRDSEQARWAADLRAAAAVVAQAPIAQPQAAWWADVVEQRLLTWRTRMMNEDGDQPALDDFIDKNSLDDLIDFVCAPIPEPQAADVVCWWNGISEGTDQADVPSYSSREDTHHDIPLYAGWNEASETVTGLKSRIAQLEAQAAGWRQEIARLRTALRFYARGQHYHLDEREEFDTVSGEPQNWLCSGLEESATMVENGRVALFALQGIDSNWRDGDDDNTPLPVEGEVSCASLYDPAWRPIETAEVPELDERKLWALLRAAVGDGASIQANNGSMAYDFITALLDGRAALRMRSLRPMVLAYAAAREAAERERCLNILRRVGHDNPLTVNDCIDLIAGGVR